MYSYILLFVWCFTASSIIPISSEPYFTTLIVTEKSWILAFIIASVGNIAGSITTFFLGKKVGEIGIQKLSSTHTQRVQYAQKKLHKHGAISLFFAWVPIIGDVLVTIAGALHFPLWHSILWISIGKCFRYAVIIAITLQFI